MDARKYTAAEAAALPEQEVAVSGHRCRFCGLRPEASDSNESIWLVVDAQLVCRECFAEVFGEEKRPGG